MLYCLIFDVDYIKEFDFQCRLKKTFLKELFADGCDSKCFWIASDESLSASCDSFLSNTNTASNDTRTFFIVDSDEGILRNRERKFPMIAWQHEENESESLIGTPWLILSPESIDRFYLDEIYARYYHLPLYLKDTSRCLIRELVPDDLSSLLSLQKEKLNTLDSSATEYAADGYFFPLSVRKAGTIDAYEHFLEDYIEHQYPFFGFGIYAILEKGSETFLGIAGFSNAINEKGGMEVPVSYSLLPEFQQQGYASEVLQTLIPFAKEYFGIEKTVAFIHKENIASLRLARKCNISIKML